MFYLTERRPITMSAQLPCLTSEEEHCLCERHGKILEYLCETHIFHVCADCAVFDHRGCKIISVNTTNEYDKVSCTISPALIKATHRIADVNPKLSRLLQSRDMVALAISNCFQKLHDAIDAAENELCSQLEFLYNVEESRLLEWKEDCQQLMTKVQTRLEDAKRSGMGSSKPPDKLVNEVKSLRQKLQDCLQKNNTNVLLTFVEGHDFDKTVEQFSLLPGKVVVKHDSPSAETPDSEGVGENVWTGIDPKSPAILSESELETFVDIPLDGATPTTPQVLNPTDIKEVANEGITSWRGATAKLSEAAKEDNNVEDGADPASLALSARGRAMSTLSMEYSLTLRNSINALMPSDKAPSWLTGATFLVNNSIAVADRKNRKVKLFSSALHCIAEVVIPSYPFDLAQTGEFDLVVTIPKHKRVQFFNSEDLKTSSMYIDTEQTCLGISCSHELIAVVCETSWTKVITIKLYNNSGVLIRKVTKIDDSRELAFTTDYISICPVSRNMAFRNGIHLFYTTSEGDLLWKSTIPSQFMSHNVRGVATLNGGVLVVFDVCVYYVTSDSRQWKLVKSFSRQSSPSAICVSRSKTSVLVTHADPIRNRPQNNLVEIFTLTQQFE